MLPILADNIKDVMTILDHNINQKGVKKRFKVFSKKLDLTFHLTLPMVVAISLYQHCEEKLDNEKIRILFHQLHDSDSLDHLRWMALIPALLSKPNLSVEVVAISSSPVKENITNARPVIDYFIDNELSSEQFSSELCVGDISELDVTSFDLILNNNPSPVDLNHLIETGLLETIVSKGIPFVLADFTEATLLNNYNLLRNWGYSSSENIFINPISAEFKSNLNSTKYRHGMYLLAVDNYKQKKPFFAIDDFATFVTCLKTRLDIGDLLSVKSIAKVTDKEHIQIFNGIIFNKKEETVSFNYLGDIYNLKYKETIPFDLTDKGTIENKADRVLWALLVYRELLNQMQEKLVSTKEVKEKVHG